MVQERIRGASAASDQKDEAGGRHQGESAVTRRLGGRAGHDREESGSREQNQDWAFGFLKGLSPRPTLMLRHLGSGGGGGGVGGFFGRLGGGCDTKRQNALRCWQE